MINFSILGHEGIIEVIDHMRPDAGLNKGDRLTFHVVNCCNKCENCKDGLQQKCVFLFKVPPPSSSSFLFSNAGYIISSQRLMWTLQ